MRHQGLIYKLSQQLPGNYWRLLQSYLQNRRFRVALEDAKSAYWPIQAGVPQVNVFSPSLYLMYTADIPTTENTITAKFADNIGILAVNNSQEEATKNLELVIDKIVEWTRRWKS